MTKTKDYSAWIALPLNLNEAQFRDSARKNFDQGDGAGFASCAYQNGAGLALVFDNTRQLISRGIYEAALLEALTGYKLNHSHWSMSVIARMLAEALPQKLRNAGEPLPGAGPFMLYRGVAGLSNKRK